MIHAKQALDGRIVIDPAILGGKPAVRGTRLSVELILRRLAQDLDLQALFEAYPRLTADDVKACLAYAHDLVEAGQPNPPAAHTKSSRLA